MNDPSIVDYWMEKALDDLASAWDNHTAGRYQNAVRDAYFACFHSFSSVLIDQEKNSRNIKKSAPSFTEISSGPKGWIPLGANIMTGFSTIGTRQITGLWFNLSRIR
jgi:hypothetical protein